MIADPEDYEREHDEALLAGVEAADPAPVIDISDDEDPEMDTESDPEEDPEEETERATEMLTPSHERTPTPPPAPMSPLPTEEDEDDDPILDAMEADPADDSPPPPPLAVVPLVYHEWIVGSYVTDLAAAEGHIAELRTQLAAERRERLGAQGGRVDTSTRRMRSSMRRIEERTLSRIRRMTASETPASRRAVMRIVADGMRRTREATRVGIR